VFQPIWLLGPIACSVCFPTYFTFLFYGVEAVSLTKSELNSLEYKAAICSFQNLSK